MRTDHGDFGMRLRERSDARRMRSEQRGRDPVRRSIQRCIERNGIASVQQPSSAPSHGDRGVTRSVSGQWDKPDVGMDFVEANGGEAKPASMAKHVRRPPGLVLPAVTQVHLSMPPGQKLLELRTVQVDRGVREIGQTSGMVEMKVCDDDVPDIRWIKSQRAELVTDVLRRGPRMSAARCPPLR